MDQLYQSLYEEGFRVRTPIFPLYSQVQAVLPVWDGCTKTDVYRMIQSILEITGTPQNPMDWTDPDTWISERMGGNYKQLAQKTWNETNGLVNPRHSYGVYMFINKFGLLNVDPVTDVYELSDRGKAFLKRDDNHLSHIDEIEGLTKLLAIISEKQPAKRSDIIEDWKEYLHDNSKFGTKSTISDSLGRRINNLLDRDLLQRNGNYYTLAQAGQKKAEKAEANSDPKKEAIRAFRNYNEEQKQTFLDRLMTIHPTKFEEFVGELLEALEYQDVVVTKQSGDKGIDVIGKAQFGITEIVEVIQVKRTKSTITRPILDQLRGAAQLQGALKGTIITLGKFAKGCKEAALHPGAMPVTLIDGNKLFEILKDHEVGVRKSEMFLIDIDESFFNQFEESL